MMERLNSKAALAKLMSGNKRYVMAKQLHSNLTSERRAELKDGQCPIAIILGCSDSRVPPELIFDQGLGDLFVVRVAGNILDNVVLGSIEYAASHLGTSLVMILGHSKCGAIEATAARGRMEGHLPCLAAAIQPSLDEVKDKPGDLINNAAKENAKMIGQKLLSEPILAARANAGKLRVVAAFYDLDTGVVEVIS
ncbi:MAG: carbonic anhydrase [Deltaproteobacteria bacterium]|nr:carbonic anhydrase [Deltaproteobacteria bacterium]